MTTLISFLGVGNKQNGGYRTTNYQFSDGEVFEQTRYIGMALAQKIKPTKVILLGTSGSMWDVFLENAGDNGMEEKWLDLSEAVDSKNVSPEHLQPFEDYLSQSLNAEVHCVLIPFAKNPKEQIEILSVLAENLNENEDVVIDVTHGFRHLPMLSLVAARFLKTVKKIDVQQIYYGAFEMSSDNKTPVLELESLLTMLDWVDALSTFDKDGDYSVFAPLLQQQGMMDTDAKQLSQASFYERISNASQARQKIGTVFNKIQKIETPIVDLFKPQLVQRLEWHKEKNRGLNEQHLAKEYLHRRDYLRAVVFAMEGMITEKTIQANKDVNDYDDRESQRHHLKNDEKFRTLTIIRNAVVHGKQEEKKKIRQILDDEQKLKQSLQERFKNLLD
ncbi:MAG: TIGR02221 family CRISPR-associated protein [Moraxella sp.]